MANCSLSSLAKAVFFAIAAFGNANAVQAVPTKIDIDHCNAAMDGELPASTPSDFQFSGNVRRFYVAAEEVEWDYAPTGWDNWLGVPFNQSPRASAAGLTQFGTKWLKALYRGYTDSTFTKRTSQPAYQGNQGPTLRGEVGDLVEILFVNKVKSAYVSMHSMGLAYTKYSEGSDYPNNTMPGQGNTLPATGAVPPVDTGVPPSHCVVYKWMINDGAGPSNGEPAKTHSYHSYVSFRQDTNTGLIGPTIVYARGMMKNTMASYREIPILYNPYDETQSWLSAENKAKLNGTQGGNNTIYAPMLPSGPPAGNETIWKPQLINYLAANGFSGAPTFYAINGYVFANNPTFEMCLNDKVIWYFNAYGQASHVFHMHGNGFKYNGNNEYAESGNDGVGKTLYMDAVGAGLWQVLCHVQNHQGMGMVANYRVYGAGECPLPPLANASA